MNSADSNKPIIVKKIKRGGEGAHGGAWKVAFADFMTSMTALFLVLYLIESTTPAEKMAISMYFNDPTGYVDGGSPFVINMGGGMRNTDSIDRVSSPAPPTQEPDVMPDKNVEPNLSKEVIEQIQEIHKQEENQKFEELKQMIEERIEADPTLGALKDQIIIKITEEGLLIEVVDKDKRPMFDSGGNVIKPYMRTILKEISKTLHDIPNPLSISGHTDAVPFTEVEGYTNWELSADRANAARRAMLKAGIKEKQISRVVGLADSQLYDKAKPENPINRRISILAMRTPADPPKVPEKKEGEGQPENAADPAFPGGVVLGAETSPPPPKIDPSLPPDADFPGAGSAPAGAPASIPAVPQGMTPQPVLPSKPAAGAAPSAEGDPFSTLSGPSKATSSSTRPTVSAPVFNGAAPNLAAPPSAARIPTVTAPATSAPPGPAPVAKPAPTPVVVPRPTNPDEEFF